MKRVLAVLLTMTLLVYLNCDKKDDQTKDGQAESLAAQAICPVCKNKMKEDAYCACCTAVATAETEPVHCDACDKDFTPGTYCAACNRFMFNAKVKCGNCQDLVPKGHYCSEEKLYKSLPDVAYCETCKKPYHKALPCPNCKKNAPQTGKERLK